MRFAISVANYRSMDDLTNMPLPPQQASEPKTPRPRQKPGPKNKPIDELVTPISFSINRDRHLAILDQYMLAQGLNCRSKAVCHILDHLVIQASPEVLRAIQGATPQNFSEGV